MEILERGRGTHFDPTMLDTFGEIARDLYDEFAGVEGEHPKRVLEAMTRKYFHESLDMLTPIDEQDGPQQTGSEAVPAGVG